MANNWQLMTTAKLNRRQTDKFDHIYFTDLRGASQAWPFMVYIQFITVNRFLPDSFFNLTPVLLIFS